MHPIQTIASVFAEHSDRLQAELDHWEGSSRPPNEEVLTRFRRENRALAAFVEAFGGVTEETFFRALLTWACAHHASNVGAAVIHAIIQTGLMPVLLRKAQECGIVKDEDVITMPDGGKFFPASVLAARLGLTHEQLGHVIERMPVVRTIRGPRGVN
jgi:hypothetical protein